MLSLGGVHREPPCLRQQVRPLVPWSTVDVVFTRGPLGISWEPPGCHGASLVSLAHACQIHKEGVDVGTWQPPLGACLAGGMDVGSRVLLAASVPQSVTFRGTAGVAVHVAHSPASRTGQDPWVVPCVFWWSWGDCPPMGSAGQWGPGEQTRTALRPGCVGQLGAESPKVGAASLGADTPVQQSQKSGLTLLWSVLEHVDRG